MLNLDLQKDFRHTKAAVTSPMWKRRSAVSAQMQSISIP